MKYTNALVLFACLLAETRACNKDIISYMPNPMDWLKCWYTPRETVSLDRKMEFTPPAGNLQIATTIWTTMGVGSLAQICKLIGANYCTIINGMQDTQVGVIRKVNLSNGKYLFVKLTGYHDNPPSSFSMSYSILPYGTAEYPYITGDMNPFNPATITNHDTTILLSQANGIVTLNWKIKYDTDCIYAPLQKVFFEKIMTTGLDQISAEVSKLLGGATPLTTG